MSEQTEVKPCCVTGHIHTGTPIGTMQVIHGLNTYVSEPKNAPPNGPVDTIVFICDVFGIYVNAKLVVDEWAAAGYRALMPDVLEGDAIPEDMLNAVVPGKRAKAEATVLSKAADSVKVAAAFGPFMLKHREAVTRPLIQKFVQAVRADPQTGKVGAVGFCWGGRYAFLLAQDNSPAPVDCAIAFHPSFLTPADVEPIKTVPCAIFKGDQDDLMDDKSLDQIEEIMKGNLGDKIHVQRFSGAVHGFSIRGDMEEGTEKADKEAAHNAAMAFIARHLGRS